MKKFLTIILTVILSLSVCMCAACKSNKGVIKGKYKEVEAAQLQTAAEKVDGNTQNDLTGFEISADIDFSYGVSDLIKFSANGSFGYTLAVSDNEDEINFAGKGNCKLKCKLTTKNPNGSLNIEKETVKASFYNDSQYLYLNIKEKKKSDKLKINFGDFIVGGNYEAREVGETETLTFNETLQMLSEAGVIIYLDDSDGIKFKLSFTEKSARRLFYTAIDSIEGIVQEEFIREISTLVAYTDFNSFKADTYLAFDKNGVFQKYGEDIDVDMIIDLSPFIHSGYNVGKINVSIKCGFSIKAYNGKVNLPEGIAEDDSYKEYLPDFN